MASRMKKMFHRSKDSDAEEPSQRTRAAQSDRSDPGLPSSRYESTKPGELPHTGDYPVKGNDNSVILHQGRRSSVSRSRRSSGTSHNMPYRSTSPNQYEAVKDVTSPPVVTGSNDPYQQSPAMPVAGREGRRPNHPSDISGLTMGNVESPTTVTQTITTTRTGNQGYNPIRFTPQTHGYAPRSAPQEQGYHRSSNATPQHPEYNSPNSTTSQSAPWSDTTPQRQDYASSNNTTPQLQESALRNSSVSQNREYAAQNSPSIRPVREGNSERASMSQPPRGAISSNSRSEAYNSPKLKSDDDAGLSRQSSIPRKQVGTSASTPYLSVSASSPPGAQTGQSRQHIATKPLPSTPATLSSGYVDRQTDSVLKPSSILNRSRPIPPSQTGLQDAQDVVARAKTNTYDTEVVEIVAPAVVHERVHNAVHHVREEIITREIHTHDVFHRVQPIVDVEVLPPRHFLPVEGGGLVEISAQEVPGRGSNWVIAETASKIPSDQAAPPGKTQFTARNFPGREGDAVEYISPEGFEKTEQTWVHPPELEEGARLTGQSWPMVIEPPGKSEHGSLGAYGSSTPKKTKSKGPGGNKPTTQASLARRAGGAPGKASA